MKLRATFDGCFDDIPHVILVVIWIKYNKMIFLLIFIFFFFGCKKQQRKILNFFLVFLKRENLENENGKGKENLVDNVIFSQFPSKIK